ncbi:MAG: hypothetical protein WC943_01435 [Elusimicrobiota bacterium]|jgi:hypothetical protein
MKRRILAGLLSLSLLDAGTAPAWAGLVSPAPVQASEASSSDTDLLQGLSAVLEETLSQAEGTNGLTLAAQSLEVDALDSETASAASAASRALLKSIENPRIVEGLRGFVRRNASQPEAAKAFSLLRRWEALLSTRDSRDKLLAGLSGSNGLDSSMGSQDRGQASTAAISSTPGAAIFTAIAASTPSESEAAAFAGPATPSSSYKDAHSGLSPPTRAPPHPSLILSSLPSRSLQKQQEARSSEANEAPLRSPDLSSLTSESHQQSISKEVL